MGRHSLAMIHPARRPRTGPRRKQDWGWGMFILALAMLGAFAPATPAQPPAENTLPKQATRFLDGVPEAATDAPTTGPLADLSLRQCLLLALEHNYTLLNARRDLEISDSSLRESEAFFIPYVELVGEATYGETRVQAPSVFGDRPGPRTRVTQNTQEGRIEVGENLPTGGRITASAASARTRGATDSGPGGGNVAYESDAGVRLTQPLLRGGGFDVGLAPLRQARLSHLAQSLNYRLGERNILVQVIQQYFDLLQAGQDLHVGRDALAEKLRFLEETRIKYQMGRVAESEILRAELQHLQEQENTIRRQQSFTERGERLALLLGLPPENELSVQDITDELVRRGKVSIPPLDEALRLGLTSRIELLLSEIQHEQARISLDVARNDVLPSLDVTSGYITSDRARSLGASYDLEDNAWDVGLGLRIPLPNIGRREALRRAALQVKKAATAREDLERQIIQEIKTAHRTVQSAEAGLTILAKTVEQARKNLELINGSFEVGMATITEVRLAQDDLFAVQTRYNNTLLDYQVAIARFYVAVGQPLL